MVIYEDYEVLERDAHGHEMIRTKDNEIRYRDVETKQFVSEDEYHFDRRNSRIIATLRLNYESPRGKRHNIYLEGQYVRIIGGDVTDRDIRETQQRLLDIVREKFYEGFVSDPNLERDMVIDYDVEETNKAPGDYGGSVRYKWKKQSKWNKIERGRGGYE